MQIEEGQDQILIAIIDETYGVEDDRWETEREAFRRDLEKEFGVGFEDTKIGPGADLPAFATVICAGATVLGAFFLGKKINENLEAWREIGKKVKRFFTKRAVLNRHGAAVMAVGAVFEQVGGLPRALRLTSYRTNHMTDLGDLKEMATDDKIADALPTLYIGFIQHIFEIEADGVIFRVAVDGRKIEVIRL